MLINVELNNELDNELIIEHRIKIWSCLTNTNEMFPISFQVLFLQKLHSLFLTKNSDVAQSASFSTISNTNYNHQQHYCMQIEIAN